jgi:hypothetical protein
MMADEEDNEHTELRNCLSGFWRGDEFDPDKIFTPLRLSIVMVSHVLQASSSMAFSIYVIALFLGTA